MGRQPSTNVAEQTWERGRYLLNGGCCVRRNRPRAEALLRRSLELEPNGEREWMFGIDLRDGAFGRERPAEALPWFRRALRHGERWARSSIAITLRDGGPGLAPDPRKALSVAVRGWRAHRDALSAAVAAETYDTLGDPAPAARWWRIAAEAGDVGAMVTFGTALRYGRGVTQDLRAAARWYRRAVSSNDPLDEDNRGVAFWNLHLCHRNGEGVRKDPREAHRCLVQAARLGHRGARRRRAESLLDGSLGRKDPVRGERLLRELARTDVDARRGLGERLTEGRGLRKSAREGLAILRDLARRGDGSAALALGVLHHNGSHVRRDRRKSVRYYRRSARLGDAGGWRNLGLCLARGEGVRRDPRRARRCFVAAARLGDGDAACRLFDELQAKDPVRAAAILRPAVADEAPGALLRMARLLLEGRVAATSEARSRRTRTTPGRPSRAARSEARALLGLARIHGVEAAVVRAVLHRSACADGGVCPLCRAAPRPPGRARRSASRS